MKPIYGCSQVFRFSNKAQFSMHYWVWTLKAMKDHEIDNIVKIDKIDIAQSTKNVLFLSISIDWQIQSISIKKWLSTIIDLSIGFPISVF